MFSEYASRYLSKSQRPAPLFNGTPSVESDVDDYLEAISTGSTEEGSEASDSDISSMVSERESNDHQSNPSHPPSSLLVERKKPVANKHKGRVPKPQTGYSLWQKNVEEWAQGNSTSKVQVAGPSNISASGPTTLVNNEYVAGNELPRPAATTEVYQSRFGYGRKPLDNVIAAVYLLSLTLSLVTAVLGALSAPINKGNIYPIFAYSSRSLFVYAVLASIVSSIWLYLMRYFTRAVVQVSAFAVPVVLVLTTIVSISMSIHPSIGWHGLAHAAMRISALAPSGIAFLWVIYLRKLKDIMGKAADFVVLTVEIYNSCAPMIVLLTMAVGIAGLAVTGSWSFFLARAFLDGHLGILLGAWYSFMYLWTWSLICSLLRAVLANVTAEWYAGNISMDGALSNSIYEAMSYHFSSACLSALVALLVRIPLFILPTRISGAMQRMVSVILSTSTIQMTNPLVLPTAVLKRCSLVNAASIINSGEFNTIDRRAYRLAKLFLISARVCCSLVVGFLAWVHADRVQDVSSAYGYLVAIIALFIGWTVMGASENMLSMIADAVLVNYVLIESSAKRELVKKLFMNTDADQEDGRNVIESEYSDSA